MTSAHNLMANVSYGVLMGVVAVITLTAFLAGTDIRPHLALLIFMVTARLLYALGYRFGQSWALRHWPAIVLEGSMIVAFVYVGVLAFMYLVANDPYPLW